MKKVTLFLLGGAVATGMAALFGAGSLALTGVIETGALPQLLPAWWIGDYAGLLALGPLMGLVLALSARACALDVTARCPAIRNYRSSTTWRGVAGPV